MAAGEVPIPDRFVVEGAVPELSDLIETLKDCRAIAVAFGEKREGDGNCCWPQPRSRRSPLLVRAATEAHPETEAEFGDEAPDGQGFTPAPEYRLGLFDGTGLVFLEQGRIGVEPALDFSEREGTLVHDLEGGFVEVVPESHFEGVESRGQGGCKGAIPEIPGDGVQVIAIFGQGVGC